MGNKLPPYDNEQVETAISEEIRKEQAGEPGYDLAKLDLGKFKNHSPSPWVINSPSMTLNSGSTVMAELYVNNMVEPDDYCLIAAAPDLLAELKEARKEIEELREMMEKIRTMAGAALTNTEKDNGGPGCCHTIADILFELEGKQ